MAPAESLLIWLSILCYGIVTGIYIYSLVFKKERLLNAAIYGAVTAFIIQSAGIAARYIAVGNLPWAGNYESALAGSWSVMLFTLYFIFRHRAFAAVGVATIPFSLLVLGLGAMNAPQLAPMALSLKSFWLAVHVFFAWLAFGSFSIAFGLGFIYVMKDRASPRDFTAKFPELPRMDDFIFQYIVFGFITDAVMIASGAIWAKDLWGNYWSWDPVEMWSLVTWLIYGIAVHLRLTRGWRGRRFAWVAVFAFAGMIISYFGVNVFVSTSLHFFGAMK